MTQILCPAHTKLSCAEGLAWFCSRTSAFSAPNPPQSRPSVCPAFPRSSNPFVSLWDWAAISRPAVFFLPFICLRRRACSALCSFRTFSYRPQAAVNGLLPIAATDTRVCQRSFWRLEQTGAARRSFRSRRPAGVLHWIPSPD